MLKKCSIKKNTEGCISLMPLVWSRCYDENVLPPTWMFVGGKWSLFRVVLKWKRGKLLTLKICSCATALTEVHLHSSRITERNLHGCGICSVPVSCWKGLGLLCHSWQKYTATILCYYMAGLKYRLFLEDMLTAYSQATAIKMFLLLNSCLPSCLRAGASDLVLQQIRSVCHVFV